MEDPEDTYRRSLAQVANHLGIKIVVDTANHQSTTVSWDKLAPSLHAPATNLLVSELSIYPLAAIRKSKIGQIVLCSNLHKAGIGSAGCTLSKGSTLLLDVSKFEENRRYTRQCVHHEIFHAIDYNDDALELLDPWWDSLNAPGTRYSTEPIRENQSCNTPGFMSTYAMQAVHEDKAELFSHLIVNYGKVDSRSRKDSVLKKKVERMKQLLYQFDSEFHEEFWRKRMDEKTVIEVQTS